MKLLLALTSFLFLLSRGASQGLSCDRTESNTCFVDVGKDFSGDIAIAPGLLDGAPEGINTLRISSGAKLRCYGTLCKITIRDFPQVFVAGTLEGSDILVEVSDRLRVPAGGLIHGNDMGYSKSTGPGSGSGSCGYKDSKYIGASHGGLGGSECANSDSRVSKATYGSASTPSDFGSGGACGNSPSKGGGRVFVTASTIAINGMIQENGGDRGGGALGSGGSILLIADQIVGSGTVEARGGSCGTATYNCAAGGGGRIALHADQISEETLTSVVAGGPMLQCDKAKGQPGTVHIQCRTTTCFNGGTALSDPDCGCDCVDPWGGGDCTTCNRICKNGGTLSPDLCVCSCPFGWTGTTCNECNGADICSAHGVCNSQKQCSCDFDYYGDECAVYCESSETCSTNGICSANGTCSCVEGKVGSSCGCDEINCAADVFRGSLCSGKGACSNGACECDPGFYGCACEVFCARSTTCSGAGTCSEDGTCECDSGYIGDDCSELDIENYCRVGENGEVYTISGHPCLLGLDDTLGYGFDIIRGARTMRVLQLRYTKGRTFNHNLLGTFEIPDNVDCEEITVDNLVASTRTYTGTLEYRMEMTTEVGVLTKFRSSFFSASAEFGRIKEFRFQQQQFLSEKKQYHRLYSCKIRTTQPLFTTQADMIVSQQTGEQRVRNLGTHVAEQAVFGGFIKVRAYVSSCILASLSKAEVSAEVNNAFNGVAVSGTYTSNCDLINTHARFEKEVGGGDKSKLIVADMTDPHFLRSWIDSLHTAPTVTRRYLYQLEFLLPAIREDIEAYEISNEVEAEVTIEDDPDACPEVAKGKSTCAARVLGQETTSGSIRNKRTCIMCMSGSMFVLLLWSFF